ncbi:MAG: hypothetical protein IPH18_03985 [Chitinophagaceae bacterium]|nr:hypothetical protein [Chitinophagaceae bacterium]
MPFEEFDMKIREAADQHHPAYDEKAWAKMEKLLDKHMPQEKKRRRFIFWFFPLVIVAGAGIFFLLPVKQNSVDLPDRTISDKFKNGNKRLNLVELPLQPFRLKKLPILSR